jgi:hypothetical protein
MRACVHAPCSSAFDTDTHRRRSGQGLAAAANRVTTATSAVFDFVDWCRVPGAAADTLSPVVAWACDSPLSTAL